MDNLNAYPGRCRRNIKRLMSTLSADADTAYKLMQMTAILTDLNTDDNKVVDIILNDCGIEHDLSLCGAE